MSIHSLFKKVLSESALLKEQKAEAAPSNPVNEVAETGDIGWLTRNNIMPNIFGGRNNGLRVPSALLAGASAPFWDREHLTYPFVGIDGYSDTAAMKAKHGNATSYMNDRLEEVGRNPKVREVLERQVAAGTGIPPDGFIIFPKQAITTVGMRGVSKSTSLFNVVNMRDQYRQGLYPYTVQQAFSVDEDGRLFVNENKRGGVVLSPAARSAQSGDRGLLYLDHLRRDDLARMAYLYDRRKFAEEFTGSAVLENPNLYHSTLASYKSGTPWTNDLDGGNPKYGKFEDFLYDNGMLNGRGDISIATVRQWILEAPADEIIDGLLIPYLLKSPYEDTYCWRRVLSEQMEAWKDDVAVYEALVSGGSPFETAVRDAESRFDVLADLPGVSEAVEAVKSVSGDSTMEEYMFIFRRFVKGGETTIAIAPKEQVDRLRYGGEVKTKGVGVRRTFARILSDRTPMSKIDEPFCPTGFTGMEKSRAFTLDYSPLFKEFKDRLDTSMPRKFSCVRIVGYTVSFDYDLEIERGYDRYVEERREKAASEGGSVAADAIRATGLGLFAAYVRSGLNPVREPSMFDVVYVDGGGYGDFLFSGYAVNSDKFMVSHEAGEPPAEIEANGLLADNVNGLHSVIVYDTDRINMQYNYNKKVY